MNNKELIEKYLKKYEDIFSPLEKQFILNYQEKDYHDKIIPDLIREVYDELGLLQDKDNIFIGFINHLDEEFSIKDKRIIEVGGGIIPRLGKRINTIQTTGNITIYDPRLSIYEESTNKLKLVRRSFTPWTNIKNSDLLIGLMPCEATEAIISNAINNNKDFMIALCDGMHGDIYDYYIETDEWIESIIHYSERLLKERNMGKIKTKSLSKYNNPYPVIYNER